MRLIKKAFLLGVGLLTLAYDEFEKSVEEALKSAEGQRQRVNKRIARETETNQSQEA